MYGKVYFFHIIIMPFFYCLTIISLQSDSDYFMLLYMLSVLLWFDQAHFILILNKKIKFSALLYCLFDTSLKLDEVEQVKTLSLLYEVGSVL